MASVLGVGSAIRYLLDWRGWPAWGWVPVWVVGFLSGEDDKKGCDKAEISEEKYLSLITGRDSGKEGFVSTSTRKASSSMGQGCQ